MTTTSSAICRPHLRLHGRQAQFLQFSGELDPLSVSLPKPETLLLHMPLPDCMLEGAGVLSSQRINLTTLSLSTRHTTHAPTAFRRRCLCRDIWRSRLLRLLCLAALTGGLMPVIDKRLPLPSHANSLRRSFLLIRAEHFPLVLFFWPIDVYLNSTSRRGIMIGCCLWPRGSFQPILNDASPPDSAGLNFSRRKTMHLYHHTGGVTKHEPA